MKMRSVLSPFPLALALAGCASLQMPQLSPAPEAPEATATAADPEARLAPADAVTVEEFDTTTSAERAAAEAAPAPAGEALLGKTVASLGDPTLGGFWLETPLVDATRQGRIESASGKSVNVELRPIDGAASAGSRISLAALRLLEVPLTDLPELSVYGG